MGKNSKGTKQLFFEVISLSERRYRVWTFIAVLFALLVTPIRVLEVYLPQLSVCHWLLDKWCYSVGITRGVASLLKGQFTQGVGYNPLSVPVLVIMLGIVVYDAYILYVRNA